jgi:putative membrane-bound dehydrogenase-like protein
MQLSQALRADQTSPKRGAAAMTVPDGFTVEAIALPPITLRPMMGSFDDRGRLYLAESAGENLEAKDLLAKTPNFIRQLTDTDGDGRFDASTIFADKMTFPMGALWYRGSVYAASPPYIWKLTDTNDDGIADQRQILVGQFGFVGNAADIHGCFLSPGGRIYWCDGRHGHEFLDEKGNVLSKGKAARIFSCLPDGTDVRWLAGGGMDNPVEVDFLPEGPVLGVVNLFYPKRGDCLVHWQHGGVYPREDMPVQLAEFKRTGDLLGPVHDFGHVAVAGCIRYQNNHLGNDFQNNWFVCFFNTHKIARVQIAPQSSSYSATSEDFLTSTDPDFHPTDIIEDADGSLIVVDTGGWFRNGCPTSQLAKPDITGGIYRIRKTTPKTPLAKETASQLQHTASHVDDPRGNKIDWQTISDHSLILQLEDPRPAVREKSKDTLALRAEPKNDPSATSATYSQLKQAFPLASTPLKREIIWTITRARQPLPPESLDDADPSVRQAALCAIQDRANHQASPPLQEKLIQLLTDDPAPAVKREAAVTLGMLGARATQPLLEAAGSASDRSLEHATLYALIESQDWDRIALGLNHQRPSVRRAALIALDQINSQRLTRDQVAPLLDTSDNALLETTLAVIAKHSGWSEEIVGLVQPWLDQTAIDPAKQSMLRGSLIAFARDPSVQTLVGQTLARPSLTPSIQQLLLDVVARSALETIPPIWIDGVRRALGVTDDSVLRSALSASARTVDTVEPELRKIVADSNRKAELRLTSARLLATGDAELDPITWSILDQSLASSDPLERLATADALAAAPLSPAQQSALTARLVEAGPVELASLLRSFERETVPASIASQLAAVLLSARARSTLSPSRLEKLITLLPAAADPLAPLLAENRSRQANQSAKIQAIVDNLPKAEIDRGALLFASARTSCSSCHRAQGKGGAIGPDLSKIGASRTPRDLAESIVLPSSSLARGYESVRVITTAGKDLTGLLAHETLDSITIRTTDRSEIQIARSEIDQLSPSPQSIMPEGLDQALSIQEASDLVAYLLSLR